jgi:hypothetical protein
MEWNQNDGGLKKAPLLAATNDLLILGDIFLSLSGT